MSAAVRQFDVVIVGAGAAGLMCAAVAGRRGRRVALLEHNAQPGRKILISGGGRCNFTNLHVTAERYISANPHFAKSALALYTPRDFIQLVDRYRIPWHEKTLGQLFCDGSARAVLDMLLAECTEAGVEIFLNARGVTVDPTEKYLVHSSAGHMRAETLVVATGGLSIPKLGATGLAYDLARRFGLRIVEPRPALVPLILAGADAGWTSLAGVATEVTARAPASTYRRPSPPFREKLLFTHRGLSGPAVLQASSYWRPGQPLVVDFAPALGKNDHLFARLKAQPSGRDLPSLRQALHGVLPHRLAAYLAENAGPAGWSNTALDAAAARLRSWEFHPAGTEGYEKAEVTAGGLDTAELSARSLEVRSIPGLFFIGEAVDVTGHLGGFNFQWAWASGVAAGRSV